MKLIKEYNLIENRKVIIWLNVVSVVSLVLFFVLFTLLSRLLPVSAEDGIQFGIWELLAVVGMYFGLIIVHELIHGLFFKVFNLEGKVKFGFKNGMAYATSPNSYYSKGKFAWIILAPFVFITLILFAAAYMGWISSYFFIVMATLHAAACVGDFYWCVLLLRAPKGTYIEDTEKGISLYEKE